MNGQTRPSRTRKCENPTESFQSLIRKLRSLGGICDCPALYAFDAQESDRPEESDRDSISGYVAPANFVVEGKLELLNTSGNVVAIDLRDIKAVYFVREFSDSDVMSRKTFTTRPRTEGLWVRLKFKDNEVIEGIMPNDLTQNPGEGFLINPPDLRSNTQRVFVPRASLSSMTVIAVVGAAQPPQRPARHAAGHAV